MDDPRSLALPTWQALTDLADAVVARSHGSFVGWGRLVLFAGATAARIGEVSGVRKEDIDRDTWMWTVKRRTTPGPGGLIDKGTKGKRARTVPIIEEVRPMVAARLDSINEPDGRLFTGPRGGRISTAVLRDTPHWDEVVTKLGYEHLRHTGLTWMADAGGPRTRPTQDRRTGIDHDNAAVPAPRSALDRAHLKAPRSPSGPHLRAV